MKMSEIINSRIAVSIYIYICAYNRNIWISGSITTRNAKLMFRVMSPENTLPAVAFRAFPGDPSRALDGACQTSRHPPEITGLTSKRSDTSMIAQWSAKNVRT